ncbi:uncharacterized protein LOC134193307 isoform X2 [Corticium candelabrum]|uniref:uncharacterized protein LOC134193307 isoform X2 n=1 Tax=Corticium candelabrum TaxID=121492 RepID=UPI002E260DA0|nr:uncharacterized protein LOC134193307 isoform X2 [Corticium candelabrum]
MAELSKSIELQPITSQPPNYDLDDSSQHVSLGYPEVPTTVPSQVTDYLPLSLCTMLYCFLPIGLIALLYSIRKSKTDENIILKSSGVETQPILRVTMGLPMSLLCSRGQFSW